MCVTYSNMPDFSKSSWLGIPKKLPWGDGIMAVEQNCAKTKTWYREGRTRVPAPTRLFSASVETQLNIVRYWKAVEMTVKANTTPFVCTKT